MLLSRDPGSWNAKAQALSTVPNCNTKCTTDKR